DLAAVAAGPDAGGSEAVLDPREVSGQGVAKGGGHVGPPGHQHSSAGSGERGLPARPDPGSFFDREHDVPHNGRSGGGPRVGQEKQGVRPGFAGGGEKKKGPRSEPRGPGSFQRWPSLTAAAVVVVAAGDVALAGGGSDGSREVAFTGRAE